MSILEFFKKLFAGEPHKVEVEYGSASDEQIMGLWRGRSQLTREARQALREEAERRGLSLEKRRPTPRWTPAPLPRRKSVSGDGLSVAFENDGSHTIHSGCDRIVLNEPRSDHDGRERSRDGLEVAQRLVARRAVVLP